MSENVLPHGFSGELRLLAERAYSAGANGAPRRRTADLVELTYLALVAKMPEHVGGDIGARLDEIESALAEHYGAQWARESVTALHYEVNKYINEPTGAETDGEICQACGKAYDDVYSVPDVVWFAITPKAGEAGLLCPTCALARTAALAVHLLGELSLTHPNSPTRPHE